MIDGDTCETVGCCKQTSLQDGRRWYPYIVLGIEEEEGVN